MPVFRIEKFNYISHASKEATDNVRRCLTHFGKEFDAPDELSAIVQAEAWQYADEHAIHALINRQTTREARDDYAEAYYAVPWYANYVQMRKNGVWQPVSHSAYEEREDISIFEPEPGSFVAEWQQFARIVALATHAENAIRIHGLNTISAFELYAQRFQPALRDIAVKAVIEWCYTNDFRVGRGNYYGCPMMKDRGLIISMMVHERDYLPSYGYAPAGAYVY